MSEPTSPENPSPGHTLSLPGVELAYDVIGATDPSDGPSDGPSAEHRTLVMIGQPMTADGFRALAAEFSDRRVVLYDPRGLGRSVRSDGDDTSVPEVQAGDLHALTRTLGDVAVDVFASSGGAVAGLAWAAAHPDDIATLVAHEPPVIGALPDAALAERANQQVADAYTAGGFGAGMASFIRLVSWPGEFTEDYLSTPAPEPNMFGLPAEDDGKRDDPLLSGRAAAVTAYRPDLDVLRSISTRIVFGVGAESRQQLPARATMALAEQLGQRAVEFPSHHGGFLPAEGPMPGKPKEFAEALRGVLDG